MNEKESPQEINNNISRELPHTHLYHSLLPIIFIVLWIIDTFFLSLTIWLNNFIPSIIRFLLFIIIFCVGIIFIQLAHKTLFEDNEPSDTLLMKGILLHVRNPMYLGILLFYVSLLFLSISIICLGYFIFVVLIYNKMVNYEENILEIRFEKDYREYKKKSAKVDS